jgi:hypothetical protein
MNWFGCVTNRNNFYFIFSYSHHYVSASTGHHLVQYTQSFLNAITPTADPVLGNRMKKELHGLSLRANYTDRATTTRRRSDCQLFADRGCHVVSVADPYGRILGFLDRSRYFSIKQLLSCTHEAEWTPFQTTTFLFHSRSDGNRTRASGSVTKYS